jgi:methanogenic corrinoid protein MtbC1
MAAKREDEGLARAQIFERDFADALLRGATFEAEGVIREAIEAGLREELIDDHVIRPALRLVGDLWEAGQISVAEEHLATSICRRVVALQREAFRVARRRSSFRIMLAAAQGEHHVVGLEMAASLMVHAGYDVRLLGADLPLSTLPTALRIHRAAVVAFTTSTSTTAAHLPTAIDLVHQHDPAAGVIIGGRGVADTWGTSSGVVLCRHVTDVVGQVDALVHQAHHN